MKDNLNENETTPDEILQENADQSDCCVHVNSLIVDVNSNPVSIRKSNLSYSSSKVWNKFKHTSSGCVEFLKNCKKPVLQQPLSANFHFCIDTIDSTKRKRSRTLRHQSETSSSSSSVSSSPILLESFSNATLQNPNYTDRNDVFEEDTESNVEPNLSKSYLTSSRNNSDFAGMGCGSSADVVFMDSTIKRQTSEERYEDDSEEQQQSDDQDSSKAGMKTRSNSDLLEEQRQQSTDVTSKLKNRWLESHFPHMLLSNDTESLNKRKLNKKNRSYSNHSKSLTHCMPDSHWWGDEENPTLSILHFNDVYEIAERKKSPVGGASRFANLFKQKIHEAEKNNRERPLVVFSGDCLNPSTLSCATKGKHMIEVLDELQVDVAVFGNHEFDFGVKHAVDCIKKMKSEWMLANVEDKLTERNLAEGISKKMITRKNGLKIGLIGLVEEEWLDTLATVEKKDLIFYDYVNVARKLAKELKDQGAHFVIALTHMRWQNDKRLAREVPDVDLILGGHDHGYGVVEVDECLIVKSGSDFYTFSTIDIVVRQTGCIDVKLTRHDVSEKSSEHDPEMQKIVQRYNQALEENLEENIGLVKADLDGNFDRIRTKETNLGNFVTDILATVTKADLVLINSGTFRSDAIHQNGEFNLRDLLQILPINDTLVSISVTGEQLLEAFENGVSKYPQSDGRFPQLSGACFGFDSKADPGKRVVQSTIRIRGQPLDLNANYTLVTKAYVARGRDGYTCFKECKLLTDPESGPLLSTVVRNHISNVYRLMEFEKSNSCQIQVSPDGRQLICNKDLDVKAAFIDTNNMEAPADAIQRSMRSVINGDVDTDIPNSCEQSSVYSESNCGTENTIHLPNFISISNDFTCEDQSTADQLTIMRKESWSLDKENAKLVEERSEHPSDLKWQVLPLLEARTFHCKPEA